MPKIYYRCCGCHRKVGTHSRNKITIKDCNCSKNKFTIGVYKCQHDYWYELLYLSLKGIYIAIKDTIKIFKTFNKKLKLVGKITQNESN